MRFRDKRLFESKRLDEVKVLDKSFVITLRVNDDEQAMIRQLRELLDVEADGKALKIAARVGLNVLQSVFGDKLLRYLSSTKRERKSDYEKGVKSQKDGFVIQP